VPSSKKTIFILKGFSFFKLKGKSVRELLQFLMNCLNDLLKLKKRDHSVRNLKKNQNLKIGILLSSATGMSTETVVIPSPLQHFIFLRVSTIDSNHERPQTFYRRGQNY
jgi:hypothetical protein